MVIKMDPGGMKSPSSSSELHIHGWEILESTYLERQEMAWQVVRGPAPLGYRLTIVGGRIVELLKRF
jgi:hypothetical protein